MSSQGVTTSGRPEVRITTGSGSITVIGEPRDGVSTDGDALVQVDGPSIKVAGKKASRSLTVRCPEGSDVVVGTRSGSLRFQGRLGAVRATTMSGRIEVADAASADIRGMSTSIRVDSCAGDCRVKTKSGSVEIGSAGSVDISVGSGSITVHHLAGGGRVRDISGSVRVDADGHDRLEVESMSGAIVVTVPSGCRPRVRAKSMSRSTDIAVPSGDDCEILAKTMSGKITVTAR